MKLHTTTTCAAAAALVASSLFVAPALASPPSGISGLNLVTGHYGEIDVKTENNKVGHWGMILKTKDDTDMGTDQITVAGGGFTGWHTHPAAVFVTVVEGSIVWYNGSDPLCPAHTYTAGQSFIEDAFVIHNAANASATAQAKFIAMHINPTGVPFRAESPKPNNCNF